MGERELVFFRRRDLKHDHLVPRRAELLQRRHQRIEPVEAIAQQDDQAAAFDRRMNLLEHAGQAGLRAGPTVRPAIARCAETSAAAWTVRIDRRPPCET